VKALYRSAKACFALDKVDEADDAISRAIKEDPENNAFQKLRCDIIKRKEIVTTRKTEEEKKIQKKRDEERALKSALKVLRLRWLIRLEKYASYQHRDHLTLDLYRAIISLIR
jgi:predicted Zn-dependent protease